VQLRFRLALAGVILALPGSAAADDVTISVVDTLTVEYRGDNQNSQSDDDDYGVLMNRLNLTGTVGDLSTQLRVDSNYFVEPPSEDYQQDTQLERITAGYRLGDWRLTAGDFYSQLGRGIVLSVRNLAEVGLDISLRGGQLVYRGDDHTWAAFAAIANPANFDSVSQKFVEDVDDVIVGTRYELGAIDAFDLGFNGVFLQPGERLNEELRDYTMAGGVTVDASGLTDWLSFYLEGAGQLRTIADSTEEGQAAYATVDLAFGDGTILLEGVYLNGWEMSGSRNSAVDSRFAYTQPPTLERIDQEVLENQTVAGGRVRTEYYVYAADLLLFANFMYRIPGVGEPAEEQQMHAYGGFELFYGDGLSHINVSGGWRDENHADGSDLKSMVHAELDWLQALTNSVSLHVTSTNEFRTFQGQDYERGGTFAGVDVTELGGLTFEFGYDTQDESEGAQNFFYAGHLFWEASDAFQLRLTGGTQRGGIKCISGVCREFPEFVGGRAQLVGRF